MTSRILITGAFGYLGGRLAAHLMEQGSDDLLLAVRPARTANHQVPGRGARIVPLDLSANPGDEGIPAGVDTVIHLASVNEIVAAQDPEQAFRVNVLGTRSLVDRAVAAGVSRLLYVSTAHVYGSPLSGRITEATPPRATHPYAYTKLIGENFVLEAHRKKQLTGVVIRLGNAMGSPVDPRIDRMRLICNDLCRLAVTTGEVALRSSGADLRNFIPIADVLRAIVHLLGKPRDDLADGLFNLGQEEAIPLGEIARLIVARAEKMGIQTRLSFGKPKPGETPVPFTYPQDKIAATGFRPQHTLSEEIDATLQFCREHFAPRATS